MKLLAKLRNSSKEELIQELVRLRKEKDQIQKELAERKKKFQTVSDISSLMENDKFSLAEIFQKIVNSISFNWQYPEKTCARIIFGKNEYRSTNFKISEWKQTEVIVVENSFNGRLEVYYLERKQEKCEEVLPKEERDLLKVIAERLGKIASRKLLEEEFTTIFEESPVAKCIIDLDNNYRFFDVNKVFLNQTGYSRKEIIGKKPTEIGLLKDAQIVNKMMADIAQNGLIENIEYKYKAKNGQEKSTIMNTKVIHINGQNLAFASFIDLTEIKRTEDELKETEARYRSLVQSQTEIISRSDFEGNITFANNAYRNTFGLRNRDLKKFNFITTVYPEDVPKVQMVFDSLKQSPHKKYIEIRNITTKGVRWFGWDNMAVLDENGKMIEFQGVGRDITNRIFNEEKIHESEKRFQLIAKNVSDVIWMYNLTQNKYTYISPSVKGLRGYTDEEVMHQTLIETLSPTNRNKLIQLLKEHVCCLEKGDVPKTLVDEVQLICKDGGMVWAEVSTYLQKNNKGEIEIFGVSRNIDERKKAEIKAQEHQIQLNAALKIAGLGYYIVSGAEAKVDFIDERAKSILGINPEPGESKTYMELWFDNIFADDRDRVFAAHNEVLCGKKKMANLVYLYHHPKKGMIWIKHNAEVLRLDDDQKSLKFFGVIQDITDRKRNELELTKSKEKAEESEKRFKTIADQTTEGITVSDLEGNYVYVNNAFCEMSGYAKDELLQMTVFDMSSKKVKPGDDTYFSKGIHSGEKQNVVLRKKDGTDYYTEITGTLIEINKQKLLLGSIRDISEIVKYENELIAAKEKAEESDRLKSAFLMNVSHEIRTPMNGILGFIDLLDQPELAEEERRSFINIVNKSGERLLNTINDIVEISKIEIGDIKLVSEEVNTEDIMHYHLNFFKLQAEGKRIELKISKLIRGTQAIIKTDKQKLDGILMNLIRNAIKFTSNGTIEIGNYIENDRIYFYVSDSGRGIPIDKQEAIFDRFVQVELGNTRAYEGSGIGLSIVKAYVNALNGDIVVKSELGVGSTFLFSLPYVTAGTKSNTPEKTEYDEIIPMKHTLLVVEDDEVNFYFLENILSKEFKLLHAEDGQEALQLFNDNPGISLVLMDIKMPGVYDGFDITRKIREVNTQIPVIAQTAYAMESDKIKALEAGCDDYISKPYSQVELNKLIKKYCCKKAG